MPDAVKICFMQATNPGDVHWHATLAFGYLRAYAEQLFPDRFEYQSPARCERRLIFRHTF